MWHIKYSLKYISNLHLFSQCYCNFLALLLFAFYCVCVCEVNLQKQTQIKDVQFCSLLFFFIFFPLPIYNQYASLCMAEGTAMKNCSRITTTPSCYIKPKIKTPLYINHQLYHSKLPPQLDAQAMINLLVCVFGGGEIFGMHAWVS